MMASINMAVETRSLVLCVEVCTGAGVHALCIEHNIVRPGGRRGWGPL